MRQASAGRASWLGFSRRWFLATLLRALPILWVVLLAGSVQLDRESAYVDYPLMHHSASAVTSLVIGAPLFVPMLSGFLVLYLPVLSVIGGGAVQVPFRVLAIAVAATVGTALWLTVGALLALIAGDSPPLADGVPGVVALSAGIGLVTPLPQQARRGRATSRSVAPPRGRPGATAEAMDGYGLAGWLPLLMPLGVLALFAFASPYTAMLLLPVVGPVLVAFAVLVLAARAALTCDD